jgi:hypothetical protein
LWFITLTRITIIFMSSNSFLAMIIIEQEMYKKTSIQIIIEL